ncbi:5-formyltetrahydrofolate cyclo-ligase [Formosa algae]|uniref:5-formyltetrahydrofolate cyclo-ligase n=1 Tax=Formosa algae TaxID=225843 RepID=UPI000CCE79BF|nr:5-formyltetrahydrofolate cyclo-ligase [Formosa algae]PNW29526.1 5-formyltetrahydrofolate cyclo-ligase [Formosa algae]
MTKSELRKHYKAKREALSLETCDDLSIDISNQLLTLPIWDKSFYHVFLTIEEQKEVNTEFILNILSGKDKNIVISKSDFKTGLMHHVLLTDATTIKKNAYNIPEPIDGIPIPNSSIEVVFIPLLAFDNTGNRIGYGKGFYDRFLDACNPDVIKIGVSYFEAEAEISDVYDFDIPLNYCVTPNQVYTF